MLGEIEKDFYCSANLWQGNIKIRVCDPEKPANEVTGICTFGCDTCLNYHRKHPTPEQFEKEYGLKYPDDAAVYIRSKKLPAKWGIDLHKRSKEDPIRNNGPGFDLICACTPWGVPPDNWRP